MVRKMTDYLVLSIGVTPHNADSAVDLQFFFKRNSIIHRWKREHLFFVN